MVTTFRLSEMIEKFADEPASDFTAEFTNPFLVIQEYDPNIKYGAEDSRTVHMNEGMIADNFLNLFGGMGGVGDPNIHYLNWADQQKITIGRHIDNPIVIDHQAISKTHAFLENPSEGTYAVTDAGSTNETYFQEKAIDKNVPYPISDGATLIFGGVIKVTLLFSQSLYNYLVWKKRLTG